MKGTATIIILLLSCTLAFAGDITMPRVTMPYTGSNGFGGAHAAHTDSVYALFANPAAMIHVREKTYFSMALAVMNPMATINLANSLLDLELGDALDLISERDGRVSLGFELRELPFSIAWVADGFGFAFMNNTLVNLSVKGGYVEAKVYEDFMFPFGFAFKFFEAKSHTIDMGVTFKPFARVMGNKTIDIIELASNSDGLLDELDIPLITGASVDLGFLYRWDAGFRAGLTFNDIYGRGSEAHNFSEDSYSGNSYVIPFSMNWGIAYDFRPERFWPDLPDYVKSLGLTVTLDWRDFTSMFNQNDFSRRNYILDIGIGFQFSMSDVFFLNLGMNEMLPAVGMGIDLGKVKIDIAYYGRELGMEPGQLSTATIEFSISVRPEAEQREWPWAKKTILGSFGIGD